MRLAIAILLVPALASAEPVFSVGAGVRRWSQPHVVDVFDARSNNPPEAELEPALELAAGGVVYRSLGARTLALVLRASLSRVTWQTGGYRSMGFYDYYPHTRYAIDAAGGVRVAGGRFWGEGWAGIEMVRTRIDHMETHFEDVLYTDEGPASWDAHFVIGASGGVDIYRELGVSLSVQQSLDEARAITLGVTYRR